MNCSNCNKFIINPDMNKTGLCPECSNKKSQKETHIKRNKRLIENHLCLNCGKKVEPVKCPNCNGILKYKQKCDKCSKRIEERRLIRKQEKK